MAPAEMSTSACANDILQTIRSAFDVLTSTDDLSPGNQNINNVLSRLVGTLSKEYPLAAERDVLNDAWLQKNRSVLLGRLSEAESAMEVFWAEELSKKAQITQKDLESFWYWQSYVDLVEREMPHLSKSWGNPSNTDNDEVGPTVKSPARANRMCIIGSGPLPLTAILMHVLSPGRQPVTCVDICPQACALSHTFIEKAGYGASIDVVCADGGFDYDYGDHSAVLVAALVPDKGRVMRRIGSTASGNPTIGIRSAERLQCILYEALDEVGIKELPEEGPVARTQRCHDVINTTVFYQATDKWRRRMAPFLRVSKL